MREDKKEGQYVADIKEIHEQFGKTWSKIFRRHQPGKKIWTEFEQAYSAYIPHAIFEDTPYRAMDFVEQLERMKESVAGFDGWTRKALRILPMEAWKDRAILENTATELGVLPDSYLHVPLPMLPKGQALRPDQHRGISIFSMTHRVVYGALWHKLKVWQESWIDDKQHGGRAK